MKELRLNLKKRGKYRKSGIILFIIASFIMIDSPFLFPIPIIGIKSVLLSLLVYSTSFFYIYKGIRLPINEFLQYVRLCGGSIEKSNLINFFKDEIDENSYAKMVDHLENLDLISLPKHDLEYVEKNAIIPENQVNITKKGIKHLKKLYRCENE